MDGGMDARVDGWWDGWMERDGWLEGWMDAMMDGWMDGRMRWDEWMDGWMQCGKHGWMHAVISKCPLRRYSVPSQRVVTIWGPFSVPRIGGLKCVHQLLVITV